MRHNHPHGPVSTIHSHQHHIGWNNAFPPVARAAPGDVLEFDCLDPSCGQINPDWKAADLARLDFGKINPTLGPIEVDGAEPGDALRITFLGYQNSGWGWTANIPGFGLLADQFKELALHIWKYDASLSKPAMFGGLAAVPLKPFCGTIGVAPAEPGLHSVVPPRQVGGNMDIRDISLGAELFLPVEVKGALFSIGDPHAAQGDGEVCGTAIESQHKVTLKLDIVKDAKLKMPRFRTPGPIARHLDEKGYDVTTGIGPDLFAGARAAVSGMIDLLTKRHNMSAVEAYMLCSVCADLKISEIVDMPNWVVSLYFPRVVLD
ncbi:MAG TPA: acetamidase/formamidase family protein [Dongiaceae bacterium]|nr:acetamidase/formamidase family protein [Dongiaceae bacterium]